MDNGTSVKPHSPSSPVAMEEEGLSVKQESCSEMHVADSSLSNDSSPLDVVNTSNPSSPLNGVREEKFLSGNSPT